MEDFSGRPARALKPSLPGPRRGQGVTLPELLVVLTMIAILAAIALPGVSGLIKRNSLFKQADQLSLIIGRARDLAMEHAMPWRMVFQPGSKYWLCYGDADDDGRKDPEERTLGPFPLANGIFFGCLAGSGPNGTSLPDDGVSFADNQICFSPLGCCNSGSIYLTDRRTSLAVRVLPASGVVRIWQYRSGWKAYK